MKKNAVRLFAYFCAIILSVVGINQALADDTMLPEYGNTPSLYGNVPSQYGAMIPRTMQALESATKEHRIPIRILFYGQSITAQPWALAVGEELKKRYPNADIIVKNLAIGGCTAPSLSIAAENDLYPFYPDLVYFHVYEGYTPSDGYEYGKLEKIVSNIRKRTTAEIILSTDHIRSSMDHNEAVDKKSYQSDEEHSEVMRELAMKYGCELADVREGFRKYLTDHHLPENHFVKDGTHLTPEGCDFMKSLVLEHFRDVPGALNPWSKCIDTIPAKPDASGCINLAFEGNRIDALAGLLKPGEKPGTARVLIDGKAPSTIPGLYTFSRASSTEIGWWPGILRVENEKPLILEDWTLKIDKLNDDAGRNFDFTVVGSKTGADGSGNSLTRFVSNSGRVVLDPVNGWTINGAMRITKKKIQVGDGFHWTVVPHFLDTYVQPDPADPARVDALVLAQGLPAGRHTLKIIPNHDGVIAIESLRVHNPPLQ